MKHVFTTGEVARICNVTVVTVNKWFDSGKLSGYKMPGSRSRRIPYDELVSFMEKYSLPMDKLEDMVPNRVLVVADDAALRKDLAGTIREYFSDVKVIELEDGYTACLELGKSPPRLVILDIFLPGVDGFEICNRIRSNPSLGSTKILAITGKASKKILKKALDAGADECLTKPIDADKVVRCASQLMNLPISRA